MKRADQYIEHLVRERGPVAVWQLAALCAMTPYVVSPVVALPFADATAPWRIALSLALSLALLSSLRIALGAMQTGGLGSAPIGGGTASTNDETLAPRANTYGLAGKEALRDAIEAAEAAEGTVGIIRFANFPAMAAYNSAAAQRVLKTFATRLLAATGPKRPAALVDGHTIAIWFDGATEAGAAQSELASIAHVLAQEIHDEDLTVAPDIHIGAARIIDPTEGAGLLVARAQASAVALKQWAAFDIAAPAVTAGEGLAERFAMEQALRRAVREQQLYLHYQPFVDVSAGKVIGAEVLLRWRHPELGDISPAHFVPILEETGLVHEIGLWTLNSACRQLAEWRSSGQATLRLAVNLSAIQLQNPSLRPMIERVVVAHGLSPADIELELTETAAMEDQTRTLTLFEELRAQGFGLAIDDFGNGHSNLNYLKNLPFTKLKIDRDFISHVDTRPGSQAICKALIGLSHGMNISVIAEGVERFEEVQTLRRLGCTVFQGFYFARGMAADELTRRMSDPDWIALIGSDVHRGRAEITKRIAP